MTSSFEPTAIAVDESIFLPDDPSASVHDQSHASVDSVGEVFVDAQIKEQIRAEAFEAGRQAERENAQERCEPVIRTLSAAASELSSQQTRYLEAQRKLIAELATEIAAHILAREISIDPDWILGQVNAAVSVINTQSPIVVELSSTDHARVLDALQAQGPPENLRIVSNPQLDAGDIRVESGSTTIDSRIASLLDGARHSMAGLETLPQPETETGGESES